MADNESNPEVEGNQQGEQATGEEVRTALIPGETFEARPVQYTMVDGQAIFEGDIILGLTRISRARRETYARKLRGRCAAQEARRALVTSSRSPCLPSRSASGPWWSPDRANGGRAG